MGAAEQSLVASDQNLPARRSPIFDLGPAQMIKAATCIADALRDVVEQQKLYTLIQGKKYVQVEGWTTLGIMLGIIPEEEWVKRLKDGSYVAKVILHNVATGARAGGASALCSINERKWGNTDDFARRSMAVTRATGKAFRLGYSWIMRLAGYEATPLEEMPESMRETPKQESRQPEPPKSSWQSERKEPAQARSGAMDAARRAIETPLAKEVINPGDQFHAKKLVAQLKSKNYDEAIFEEVGNRLRGKTWDDVFKVAEEVAREHDHGR
jgi:hypothetical protein